MKTDGPTIDVSRPWGGFSSLLMGDGFQVKYIAVNPGEKLSLQSHAYRSEHWVVVSGQGIATRVTGSEHENFHLSSGDSVFIPQGYIHRLENNGDVMLEVIEVQRGQYLGEDDIVRYDDIYGRPTSTP